MIKYQLQCEREHAFEAWFANSAAFDKQAKRKLVTCPECGSTKVEKSIMAPNVGVKGNKRSEVAVAPAMAMAANAQAASQTEAYAELRNLMRRVREEVVAKAEYVGPNFAEEARKIHYEETEKRSIYGEASEEESKALAEEGVEFARIPWLPRTNS